MNRLKRLLSNLRASFWLVPSLIIALSIALAVAAVEADYAVSKQWLARLASRNIPSSHRHEDGDLRVIAIGPTFASLVAESFDQIRGSANGNLAVLLRMIGALQTIGGLTASPGRRRVLREEMEWIGELAARTIEALHDRARFESRLVRVRAALEAEPALAQAAKAQA
jgi:uncharacterized membrane protein